MLKPVYIKKESPRLEANPAADPQKPLATVEPTYLAPANASAFSAAF